MGTMQYYYNSSLKLADINKKTGTFINSRVNIRLGAGLRVDSLVEKLKANPPLTLAGGSVWRIDHTDGFKFILKDGSWLGLRPSGTEPLVRVYAEAPTKAKMETLLDAGKKIISGKFPVLIARPLVIRQLIKIRAIEIIRQRGYCQQHCHQ